MPHSLRRTGGQADGRADERTGGRADGRADGRTGGRTRGRANYTKELAWSCLTRLAALGSLGE